MKDRTAGNFHRLNIQENVVVFPDMHILAEYKFDLGDIRLSERLVNAPS